MDFIEHNGINADKKVELAKIDTTVAEREEIKIDPLQEYHSINDEGNDAGEALVKEPMLIQAPLEEAAEIPVVKRNRLMLPAHDYQSLLKTEDLLKRSKRGEKEDGKVMQKIKSMHTRIMSYKDVKVGDEGERVKVDACLELMEQLCGHCDDYISHHHPWTKVGKARLAMVKELREIMHLKAEAFRSVAANAGEFYRDATVGDILDLMDKGAHLSFRKLDKKSEKTQEDYENEVFSVQKTAFKEMRAHKMTSTGFEGFDKAFDLRDAVDMQIKKLSDYKEVRALSEFCYEDKEEFEALLKDYGNYDKERIEAENAERKARIKELEKKKEESKEKWAQDRKEAVLRRIKERNEQNKPNHKRVLDACKKKVLAISLREMNLSGEAGVAANAERLEDIRLKLGAFEELLAANPDYMKELSLNEAMELSDHMEKLRAVTDYYRVWKLLMAEPEFINRNEAFSVEETQGDSFEMARIRKLMRSCYYLGERLQKKTGLEPIPVTQPKTTNNDSAVALVLLPLETFEESDYYRPYQEAKTEEEKKEAYLGFLAGREKVRISKEAYINRCEQEQFFVPPEEYLRITLQSADTYNKDGLISLIGSLDNEVMREEEYGKDGMAFNAAMDKYKANNGGHLETPREANAVTFTNNVEISDQLSRMEPYLATTFRYRRSAKEMVEIVKGLNISHTKGYDKEDPDAVAFAESQYKEMGLKMLSVQYALGQRLQYGLGERIFYMHPLDLLTQSTRQLKMDLLACSIVTNPYTAANIPLLKEFLAQNNADSRYPVEVDKMGETNTAYGTLLSWQFKDMLDLGETMLGKLNGKKFQDYYGREIDDNTAEELAESEDTHDDLFAGINLDEVEREARDYAKKNPKDPLSMQIDRLTKRDGAPAVLLAVYSMLHPEKFDVTLMNKGGNMGSNFIQRIIRKGRGVVNLTFNEVKSFLASDKGPYVKKFTREEMEAYEKSLKERKFFTFGAPDDPYDFQRNYKDSLGRRYEVIAREEEKKK
ncbi:MAG: hypothetical protein K6G07_06195 [Lachnospiraceae bacterium]|nr:hypothetical protein [Lachnospiraceae bacterium]